MERDTKGGDSVLETLDFGNEILSGAFSSCYLFDVPTGAFTNPPLLSISFDASGNPDGDGTPSLPPQPTVGPPFHRRPRALTR